MSNLVFLKPNKITAEPFTTSDVIAEHAKVSHHAVQQMIIKHEDDIKEFGTVAFEMRACPHRTGSSTEKVYHLNEEQSTLLITYLKNTEPVREFKKALVREFYAMRTELQRRQMLREQLKPIRRELTDVIQEVLPDNRWAYKQYTDLAYKSTLGKNASQLRKERGAKPHDIAIDYMTADEITRVAKAQNNITVLVDIGMSYEQVKELMLNQRRVSKMTGVMV